MAKPKRLTGTLIRMDPRGFGFIHTPAHGEFYAHISEMRDRKEWNEGAEVSFVPGAAEGKKAPPATDVAAKEAIDAN